MSEKLKSPAWNKVRTDIKAMPKFLKAGTMIDVNPQRPPVPIEVDGKFGKRLMYVIDTELGLVYVTPVQILKIAEAFNDDYSEAITVTL